MSNHNLIAAAAAALLTLGLAAPAAAAPPPPPGAGTTPAPGYYTNAIMKLPSCKSMGNVSTFDLSASTFTALGDQSNPLTHTGYGTLMNSAHTIIEDGGYSCSWQVDKKKTLTISIAPISTADRASIQSLYLSTYGATPTSIGGANVYFHGYAGTTHEVGFLLEEGVYLTGKVTSDGDYFPAVLQEIGDLVYYYNN